MPSPLEINKQAQRRLLAKISAHNGEYVTGAYGEDTDPVGSFAPMSFVDVRGTRPFTSEEIYFLNGLTAPIQVCTRVLRDGSFASSNNYLHDRYRRRWAYHWDSDVFQYQELLDDPEDSARELWIPLLELR